MLSSYVALLAAASLATAMVFSLQISAANQHAEKIILLTMRKKFIDLNLKNLIRSALHQAEGQTCEEKIGSAALMLKQVEQSAKEFYKTENVEVKGWAGFIDHEGKCIYCLDLLQSQIVLYCNERWVKVSQSNFDQPIGIPAVGFDVYDATTNSSWRTIAKEGFE